MATPAVTAESIRRAVEECKLLGHAAFLKKYGYRSGRDYFLVVEGQDYDTRAILGVAYGYERPEGGALRGEEFPGARKERLSWSQLSGGAKTVEELLRQLAFEVRRVKTAEGSGED